MDGLARQLMLDFLPHFPKRRTPRFLFLGAHSDDIEIGCGGTVAALRRAYPAAVVTWIIIGARDERAAEARRAARILLGDIPKSQVIIQEFQDGHFPTAGAEIKSFFESIKKSCNPDIIFTHHRDDLHQDHRTVGELTWNTFRDHAIIEYEIPKYDGNLGSPAVYVPLTAAAARRKVDLLMKVYKTQTTKRWFAPETFLGLMRLRGMECNAAEGYAEAFYVRKLVLGLGAVPRT